MDKLQKQQEILGRNILKNCRNELYQSFPYLDSVFAGVDFQAQWEYEGVGTDGDRILFYPEDLLRCYVKNPTHVLKGYLHLLLHCLYLHVLPEAGLEKQRWNTACDMAVGLLILKVRETAASFFDMISTDNELYQREKIQKDCAQRLSQAFNKGGFSAEELYVLLGQNFFPYSIDTLEQVFFFDDHRIWWMERSEYIREGLKRKWEKLQGTIGGNRLGLVQEAGSEEGSEQEKVGDITKSRYDYRKFLKRFAVLREEMELDMESFDYIYYSYGMEQYKNMPLIEPLEYKEGHKLEELVIAIDTSGSCSTEMVRQFLKESYAILGEKENFFQYMKVYLIQCDCVVQDVICIHSEKEWIQYCNNLEIQGRAGTDFRPVFRYVEKLREEKELKNLKALIYFTDGDGVYPREATEYETAFVFIKRTEGLEFVPGWAKSLVVEKI